MAIKGLEALYALVPTLFYSNGGKDYNTPTADMTAEGLVYALQYGYKQSAADAKAGIASDVLEKHQAAAKASGNVDADGKPIVDQAAVDAEVAKEEHDSTMERVANIRAGTVKSRVRGPKDPTRDLADEWLRDGYRKANMKLPADKKELRALVDAVMERNKDALAAELKRRASANKIKIDLPIPAAA